MTIAGGSLLEITAIMQLDSSVLMNVWQYEVGTIVVVPTAAQIGEAWWNHVKGTYRALAETALAPSFTSVKVLELNAPTGAYGEFAVPPAEQAGTRGSTAQPQNLPAFTAVGVRLTVSSRTTRPGQKRIPFATESDVAGRVVESAFVSLVEAHMDVMVTPITLGAPAAAVELFPVVVRKDGTGAVTAHQLIEGYLVDPWVTTQVSRRYGRGV
jgi:hypothetical protein